MIQSNVEVIPPVRSSTASSTPPATTPSIEDLVKRARQAVPKGEFH